jgi:hypothetical protein
MESLVGHFDPDFPSFDLNIPDDVRLSVWKQDFDSLVAAAALPRLSIIRFPNDHTAGAKVGMPTPKAMVAENDLAVGKFLEHLSRSAIWKESAVFILEDDAQAGPDHVDAHRSIAFVVSPYAKRKAHVGRMYSTASLLRTIELILGLHPMSQYDAGATPMWECFTSSAVMTPYQAKPATYDVHEMNKKLTAIARRSAEFNLTMMDAAPDLEFNQVIWKTVKGLDSEMPVPVRSAFIKHLNENEDEDD